MRKIVVLLVVLLVLAGVAGFAVANFNSYLQDNRAWLAEQVSAALGRPVSFEEVGVSFRGGLGARVGDLKIGDDPAYSEKSFLEVGRADVVVKILPALSGSYEVDRIVLDAPRVNVIRTAKGFNFDSIGGSGGKASAGSAPDAGGKPKSSDGALPFLVSLLEIHDGRVSFVDKTASPAADLVVEQIDFFASDLGFDSPISIDLAMAVLGFTEQNVEVSGTVGPVGSPKAASSMPLDLNVGVGPIIVDRVKKLAVIGESVPAELSSPDPLTLKVDVGGRADAPEVVVSMDATDAGLRYGDVFKKPGGTRFTVEANVAQSPGKIDIANFVLRLADATLKGGGSIGTGASSPLDFKIRGAGIPLAGWGRFFAAAEGLDVDGALDLDVTARGAASAGIPALNGTLDLKGVRAVQPGGGVEISDLTTQIALRGDRVEIPPTELKIGGEPVRLDATVTSLKNPSAEFSLTAARLPLAAVGAAGEGLSKDESLNDLQVKGTFQSAASGPQARASLRSASGTLRDVDYESLNADVGLAGGRARLQKVSVKAFQGLLTGAGTYDTSKGKDPVFDFGGRVSGLDVASIAKYLGVGSAVRMTGRVNGDVALDGSGSATEQILRNLNGTGSLKVLDGVLKGVNLAEEALNSITGLPGLSNLIPQKTRAKYPDLFAQSDTIFENLGGEMRIDDGKMNLQDLVLAARDYRLNGAGKVGFDRTVEIGTMFVASAGLTEDLLGNVREVKYLLDSNGRFELPLRLTGNLPDIKVRPDTAAVGKKLSGALVSEGIGKGLDALLGKKDKKKSPTAADPTAPDAQSGAPDLGAELPSGAPKPEAKAKPEDAAEQLLRKGLEGLLGGGKKPQPSAPTPPKGRGAVGLDPS